MDTLPLLDLPWARCNLVQGIFIASHKARLWTRRIQLLKCFLCFQLHCPTKRTLVKFQERASFSVPLGRNRNKKWENKKPPGWGGLRFDKRLQQQFARHERDQIRCYRTPLSTTMNGRQVRSTIEPSGFAIKRRYTESPARYESNHSIICLSLEKSII